MEEILNRVLGFMPARSVFWSALGTALFALAVQYGYGWLDRVTILPWRREENQKNRQRIQKETNKKETS